MEKNVVEESWSGGSAAHNYQQVDLKCYPKEIVDLNKVVKDCLVALKKELQGLNAIVRYDVLPLIIGTKEKVHTLFLNLFLSIIKYPPASTKLFIYVRCQLSSSDTMDLSLPDGYQHFTLSVYTNIMCDDAWQKENEHVLLENSSLSQNIGGLFTFNNIVNTGCLYSVQLPGKPIE